MSASIGSTTTVGGRGGVTTPRSVWQREHRFFSGMSLAIALTVFVGFAPTYYLKGAFGAPQLSPLFHLHGFLFSAWIVLLVVQTRLVAAGRTDWHRRLGVGGSVLAGAMVVAGLTASIAAARRGNPPSDIANLPPPLVFLAIPLADMVVFSALVGAGVFYRRRSDIHKRLLLLATIGMLAAPIARFPVVRDIGPAAFFGGMLMFVVALAVYDFTSRGRVHRATVWGGLLIVLSVPARLWISNTATWLTFATWLTQ